MSNKWKIVLGLVGALALVGLLLPQAALAYGGSEGDKGRGNMINSYGALVRGFRSGTVGENALQANLSIQSESKAFGPG